MVFDSLLDLKMEIPLCGYLGEVFFWSRPDPANLVTLHASALGVERLATLRLSGRSRLVGIKDVKRISGFEDLVRAIHLPVRQLHTMQSANIHMFSVQGANLLGNYTHHVVELGSPSPILSTPLSISKAFCSLHWKSKLFTRLQPPFTPLQLRD
jgi:hypothetical protein